MRPLAIALAGLTRTRTLVLALLVLHGALLVHSARVHSPTVDETAHIAAGIRSWKTGAFELYSVSPPLWRMIAVLPVLAAGVNDNFLRTAGPFDDIVRAEGVATLALVEDNGARIFDLVFLARLAGIIWSLAGAWLVFCWSRELFGERAGCLALALWCLEPMVLGHAALVTPDIPATVTGLGATYAFWRYVRSPSWRGAAWVGLLLGIAQLTKFTNLLFYAVWPLLWVGFRWGKLRAWWRAGPWRTLGQAAVVVVTSVIVLNAGYAFRGTGTRIERYRFVSESLSGREFTAEDRFPALSRIIWGNRFAGTTLGMLPAPIPSSYLVGLDHQRADFDRRLRSYLGGEWKYGGWPHYYLYALGVKAPLGAWALVLWGLARGLRACVRRRELLFCLVPPLALLALVSSQTGFSAHLRYALPLFPFVFVLAGAAARAAAASRWRAAAAYALLGWSALSSLRAHPHSLAYFNELAGGPENGSAHLLDSNVDWGQDLLYLRDWIGEHPEASPLSVAYVGPVDPKWAGVEVGRPFHSSSDAAARDMAGEACPGPRPGFFAVSANLVRGMTLRAVLNKNGRRRGTRADDYSYFAGIEPYARVGYSILVYRIDHGEADALRRGLGLAPLSPMAGSDSLTGSPQPHAAIVGPPRNEGSAP